MAPSCLAYSRKCCWNKSLILSRVSSLIPEMFRFSNNLQILNDILYILILFNGASWLFWHSKVVASFYFNIIYTIAATVTPKWSRCRILCFYCLFQHKRQLKYKLTKKVLHCKKAFHYCKKALHCWMQKLCLKIALNKAWDKNIRIGNRRNIHHDTAHHYNQWKRDV